MWLRSDKFILGASEWRAGKTDELSLLALTLILDLTREETGCVEQEGGQRATAAGKLNRDAPPQATATQLARIDQRVRASAPAQLVAQLVP